jgi:hypothetical protein
MAVSMTSTNERDLIAGTIHDLSESLDILRHRRAELDIEIEAKQQRLAAWEKRLASLAEEPKPERSRRPKGANLRAVTSYLANCVEGVAPAQIREETGLPWSSVQAVLAKNADTFEQVNGLVRLRASNRNGVVHVEESV